MNPAHVLTSLELLDCLAPEELERACSCLEIELVDVADFRAFWGAVDRRAA